MFEYDYCFCGNSNDCPHEHECKRAVKIVGIHTYSDFYKEGKECEYFWRKENNK